MIFKIQHLQLLIVKKSLALFVLLVLFLSCNEPLIEREKASDKIIHIEDIIYTEIPQLPRLCDSLDLVSLKVDIGDCLLHIEIEGKGNPIVLINGGPGGTHHYFHPWFSNLSNEYKIIYYDQRGTGQSEFNEGNGYSFKQAVNDLEILRSKLNIDKWIICGYSYGGGLAQYYALKYPERVNALVLISASPMLPNAVFEDNQEKYLSQEEILKKEEIIRKYVLKEIKFKPFLYNLTLNGDWKRQHYFKPTQSEMIRAALYEWENDEKFNSIMSENYQQYNFKGLFDKCPIPTLIFEGGEDLTWGTYKARVFKNNHPNATFFKLHSTGHPIFSERPHVFYSILTNFISNLNVVSESQIRKWENSQPIQY